MKPWMKVLMWFGLGGSLGYVIGKRYGYTKAKKEDEELVNDAYERGIQDAEPVHQFADSIQQLKDGLGYTFPNPDEQTVNDDTIQGRTLSFPESMMVGIQDPMDVPEGAIQGARAKGNPVDEYAGDGIHMVDIPEDDPIVEVLTPVHPEGEDDESWEPVDAEDDAEMPMEEPTMPDDGVGDIVQFHPTYTAPQIVTQEEYDQRGDLDEKVLIFYEGDEVLYCTEDQKPMGEEDQYSTIGIGTLNEFHAGPGAAKDEIYVINETYGRFKIIRVDGAFVDEVDGIAGPEDDDEESDRFWNNGDC